MSLRFLMAILIVALSLVACDSSDSGDRAEDDKSGPVGTLTFAFQPQENPDGLQLDVERFAEFVGERTNHDVEVFLPTNYASVVEALRSGNADVAYFSGLPYLHAHEKAGAQLLVVEERDGNPYYYSQWYALADSDIEELSDLEGRSIAFTSPSSTSGFLFPLAEVIDQGLLARGGDPQSFFDNVLYAGGYQQALMALVNGRVEAAAASDYALQTYLSEEEQAKLKVIARQGPVPTHGLAIHPDIDAELKEAIRDALLELNEEEHRELLTSVYGAEKLVVQDHDEHVSALRHAYELVDLDSTL
jgi:phosphonate transport system substrate-binding protein